MWSARRARRSCSRRGVHEATGTFDIGNPNLKIEVAKSVEAGLRRAVGPFRFEATAYYTRFDGFIFRQLTGETCEGDVRDLHAGRARRRPEPGDLVAARCDLPRRRDPGAARRGAAVDRACGASTANTTSCAPPSPTASNVPRIPPQRVGGGVFWRDANWFTRIGLLHAFAQNDIAENETPTAGYDLLKAELAYRKRLNPLLNGGVSEIAYGIVGTNLLNDDVRNHVSFKKDEVLLPGRGVKFFANVRF